MMINGSTTLKGLKFKARVKPWTHGMGGGNEAKLSVGV